MMFKKSISVLMAILIAVGSLVIAPAAAESSASSAGAAVDNGDITVTGTNSLGAMLAAEYEEYEAAEAEDDESYTASAVYAVEVEGSAAQAELYAAQDAQLIVALFYEDGKAMYGSGMTEVGPDDSIVDLTIEADPMPQYFIIRAFLIDKYTNLPLCKQYESDYYTREMQEFFAKTTDDFDEEKVLNLDEDTDNNFLVYNEDTIIIENDDESKNIVTKADDEAKEYVIENIDDAVAALQPGDTFSYDDGDQLIIVKIASISFDGDTAVIIGEDTELNEVFDFIRIDGSQGLSEGSVDNSDIDEGLEFAGYRSEYSAVPTGGDKDIAATGYEVINASDTKGISAEYTFKEIKTGESAVKGTVTGSVSVGIDVGVSCFYDQSFTSKEVRFDFYAKYSISLGASFSWSASKKWKLGYAVFPIAGGIINVCLTPSFVVEGSISGSVSGNISGQLGCSLRNGEWSKNNKSPKCDIEFKFEASVFIGLSLEPEINICKSIVSCKASLKGGVKIKAELTQPEDTGVLERHECKKCIKGTTSFVIEGKITISFLKKKDNDEEENKKDESKLKNLEISADFAKLSFKLSDFYYSIDHNEFAWSTCPHKLYRSTFRVMISDPDTKKLSPAAGASVSALDESETTDSTGFVVFYLPKGSCTVTATSGEMSSSLNLYISKADTSTITLKPEVKPTEPVTEAPTESATQPATEAPTEIPTETQPPTEAPTEEPNLTHGEVIETGECGDNVYYTYYVDHTLVIYGSGAIKDFHIYAEGYKSYNTDAPWNSYKSAIESVVVKNGITSIGECAFRYCVNCTDVHIPDSVTKIGSEAFRYCNKLADITLPHSITSISKYSFMDTGFYEDSTNYQNGILYIGEYLINCDNWYNNSETWSCTVKQGTRVIANSAFVSCSLVTSIMLPDSVKYIGNSAFAQCSRLSYINIPYGVEIINDYMFQGCYNLTSITIPNSVSSIGNSAFDYCIGLTSINIPDSVTYIDNRAFNDCSGLSHVTIPETVTDIGMLAFSNCTNLTEVTLPNSLTNIGKRAFGYTYTWDNRTFKNVYTKIQGFVIYGFSDSIANLYATENGIDFISIGDLAVVGYESEWTLSTASTGSHNTMRSLDQYLALTAESKNTLSYSVSRAHLIPDTAAVLIILEGNEDTAELRTSHLLYIAQGTTDDNGIIGFDAPIEFVDKTWTAKIYGQCDHSPMTWTTIMEPTDDSEGVKICICDYCGEVIDDEIIPAIEPILLGDADGSGEVDTIDATIVQRHVTLLTVPYPIEQLMNADVDGDGELTVVDATFIQRYSTLVSTPYPIGEPISAD